MTDLVKIARGFTLVDDNRTHYPGCERDHISCLVSIMADEIERLRAALERAHDVWETEAAGMRDEIERLRADAERYRFLRTGRHWPCVFADYDDPEPLCERELDIAIDAATKEERK